jgi:DNA-binding beta-propeller fold protein YncE
MRGWKVRGFWILVAATIAAAVSGCSSTNTSIGVTISPAQTTILPAATQLFTSSVTGISSNTVTWAVSPGPETKNIIPITGGNSTIGTITANGLYTAPATIPNPNTITIWAVSTVDTTVAGTAQVTIDSGVRVSVIPSTETCQTIAPVTTSLEVSTTFQFIACVTGTTNTGVTWAVNKIAGGNISVGTISGSGLYTAPVAAISGVTITATSAADPNQSGNLTLDVGALADPTLTSIIPSTVPQGSIQQDIYVTGTNFFSTSSVLLNGSLSNITTTYISSTKLRARIAAPALAANALLQLSVINTTASVSSIANLTVQPVRPGLISTEPNTFPQNTSSPSVTLTGGFYTSQTQAVFNGQQQVTSVQVADPRHLTVNLSSASANSAFGTPGLYPLVLTNAGVPAGLPASAGTNVAVSSIAADVPTAAQSTVAVGQGPSAIAINIATGTAVVANTAANTVSIVNLNTAPPTVTATLPVGPSPTGVAVDDILNLALVVNSGTGTGGNSVSVVNLAAPAVTSTISLSGYTPLPAPTGQAIAPVSIGINPLTHRAIVVDTFTNTSTIIDLVNANPGATPPCGTPPCVLLTAGGSANPISTGQSPQVTIDPRLNWALVSPGGVGTVSIVDLGLPASAGNSGRLPAAIATYSLSTTAQGIALNTETRQLFLTDPDNTAVTSFSELDQTFGSITTVKGQVAAAVNPLTNIGVAVASSGSAYVFDLNAGQPLPATTGTPTGIAVGTNPAAVAIDPTTNTAIVVNQGSNNISVVSLGPIRPLQIVESSPDLTYTSTSPLTMTVTGNGFVSGSTVQLDQTAVPTTTVASSCNNGVCRQLQATIPASMLAVAHRFMVGVQNPDLTLSNVEEFTVVQPVAVGNMPEAVTIDPTRELAIVTNQNGCTAPGSVSIVNIATATAGAPISVGVCPYDVAANPTLGQAVVTNFADNSVSTVDIVNNVLVNTFPVCSTCTQPQGVAIDQDVQTGVVANFESNNASILAVSSTSGGTPVAVDQGPVAVAADPTLHYALMATDSTVAGTQTSTADLLNVTTNSLIGRISNLQQPTDVKLDPVLDQFLVSDAEQNTVFVVDPVSLIATNFNVGINPTALDYNYQTSTLVTTNYLSKTISVADYLGRRVRAALPVGVSPQFGVAIDPMRNLAVVVDQANNRVLLVPLPQ